jgi:hypothetical protein
MTSTGAWTFEIPQNPNCPESRLFLTKFNLTKKITQAKKELMQARKDMLPCAFRGVRIILPYLGLAWTSCPVLESGHSRYLKIQTVQNPDYS